MKYCVEINNLLLKLYRKVKEIEEPKQFWKKSLDSRVLISRLSYSKTAYNRQKESQQITDTERRSEIGIHTYIHMYICAQMIFDKDAKTTHQETFTTKQTLTVQLSCNKWCLEQLDIYMQKNRNLNSHEN